MLPIDMSNVTSYAGRLGGLMNQCTDETGLRRMSHRCTGRQGMLGNSQQQAVFLGEALQCAFTVEVHSARIFVRQIS